MPAMMAAPAVARRRERGGFGVALMAAMVLEGAAVFAIGSLPARTVEPAKQPPMQIHAVAQPPAPPAPEPPPPEPPPPEPPPPEPPPAQPPPPEPPPPEPPPPEPPPPEPPPPQPPPPEPPPPEPPPPPPTTRPPPPHAVPRPTAAPRPRPASPPPPVAQPATEPAPQAPVASAAAVATATDLYTVALRARVQGNLVVPSAVRLLGIGGVCRVAIVLDPNGALVGTTIAKSSGSEEIDAAALRSVQGSRYPAFTPQMPQHRLTFVLNVRISP